MTTNTPRPAATVADLLARRPELAELPRPHVGTHQLSAVLESA